MTRTKKSARMLLKGAKLKVTNDRLQLLAAVRTGTHKPLTIAEIHARMKGASDLATVYRVVKVLCDRGLLRRVELHHRHAHYEFAEQGNHHHHLTCTRCKKMQDIPLCVPVDLAVRALKAAPEFSRILSHSFELFGICAACDAKKSK